MGEQGRREDQTGLAAFPTAESARVTILLVDDDPLLRNLVRRMLTRAGYEVLVATGGAQALALAAEHRIDLLLTDVIMPGMDGRQLAEAILAQQPEARVLFMSGCFDGSLSLAEQQQLPILLLKPFTREALAARVEQILLS
ncbi:MAG: response regulator [Armatimonadetes bacterium]|nr:response regulator [Armatimonadota bacterium]